MGGDTLGVFWLTGIGAVTAASPAPKVFTTVGGMEPFSTRFVLEWDERDGSTSSIELTPEVYSRLRGPYNRRNALGAVLAAGPALLDSAVTAAMARDVARYALSLGSPVLRELGIEPRELAGPLRIRYLPTAASPMSELPTVIEVAP
jgi:hypothetical protein